MQTILLLTLACFIFGAIIGSFLGVCAYRIPNARYEPIHDGVKELEAPVSIIKPARSFCPCCKKQLLWWQNIPLVSWVLLRGKCGFCAAEIPFRYFFIELLTGIVAILCLFRFGVTFTGLAAFAFIALLIIITYIDLDYMIIPDVITYPTTVVGLMIGVANSYFTTPVAPFLHYPFVTSLFDSLLGLLAGPGVLLVVWWLYFKIRKREGLGLGDVKLLAMVGTCFGIFGAWFTTFLGSVIGSLCGIAIIVIRRSSMNSYIPFGPYLALGAALYILDGYELCSYLFNATTLTRWWIFNAL